MYRANLKPFTGFDFPVATDDFRLAYTVIVRQARAAGSLDDPTFVRITADHNRNCHYSIGNVGGHIVVGRPDKGIEIGRRF